MCFPLALVVASAYATRNPEQVKIRKDVGKIQTQMALQLMEGAGVVISEGGCSIPELQHEFKVVVYTYGNKGRDVMFKGSEEAPCLNLLYHEGQYNVIISLTFAAFCCIYYCEACHIPYDHKNGVEERALVVNKVPPVHKVPRLHMKIIKGQRCCTNHMKPGSCENISICQQIKRCEECLKAVKSNRKHVCSEKYLNHVPADHMCYMQPDTRKPKSEDLLFVFYYLKTRQEKVQQDGIHLHEPNLFQWCNNCLNSKSGMIWTKCGVRLQVLKSAEPISPFVHHILTLRKKSKQTHLNPELIMRGTEIIMMEVGNVKLLDSLNYFPMALSKLPKAFRLGDNYKK
ncbi:hypothetical protein NQ315_014417 [Exocentrus adspersus]|uniref:Uncharacterized protein n=1 Tax=Exocentrus adspersus TaxID=1586481 RepID=A0AAV8VF49_9CUCU|nr:hypothetical protein NQ315_014417 [Exocentrus adspersus]